MFYTKAKVLYDFSPESATELACSEGDTICIAQEDSGDGWCVCFHPNSPEIQGLVPSSYLEILEQRSPAPSSFSRSFFNTTTTTSSNSISNENDTEEVNEEASEDTISKDESDDEKPVAKESKDVKSASGFFRGLRRGSVMGKSKPSTNSSSVSGPKKISGPKNVVITKQAPAAGETPSSNTSSEADASPTPSTTISNSGPTSPAIMESSTAPEQLAESPVEKKKPKGPPKYSEAEGKKLAFKYLVNYNRKRKFDIFFKDKQFRPGRTRIELLREVLSTERTYVKMMEIFVSVFIEPIKKKTKILDEAHQKAIFSNAEQILRVNITLLMDLEKNMNKFPLCEMGAVFRRMAPFLKVYSPYINNYDNAFTRFEKYEKKFPKFREYIQECYSNPKTERHKFDSFLILPVQRIPRYKMLLAEILKNTPEDHTEYNDIKMALDEISTVAVFANENKRQKEYNQQLIELSKDLKKKFSTLVQPNRQFIREGNLKMRCVTRNIIDEPFKATMCSDVLILLENNDKKKVSKRNVFFFFFAVCRNLEKSRDSYGLEFSFDILLDGTAERIVLIANTPEERAQWENSLGEWFENIKKSIANKGLTQDLFKLNQERINLNQNAVSILQDYEKQEKEFNSLEKKLGKLDTDLRQHVEQLRQLLDKIQKERVDKFKTEQQLDSLSDSKESLRSNLAVVLSDIRSRDNAVMSVLEEDDAFRFIFGESPSSERAHNEIIPQSRIARKFCTYPASSLNKIELPNINIDCSTGNMSAGLLDTLADKRKSLPANFNLQAALAANGPIVPSVPPLNVPTNPVPPPPPAKTALSAPPPPPPNKVPPLKVSEQSTSSPVSKAPPPKLEEKKAPEVPLKTAASKMLPETPPKSPRNVTRSAPTPPAKPSPPARPTPTIQAKSAPLPPPKTTNESESKDSKPAPPAKPAPSKTTVTSSSPTAPAPSPTTTFQTEPKKAASGPVPPVKPKEMEKSSAASSPVSTPSKPPLKPSSPATVSTPEPKKTETVSSSATTKSFTPTNSTSKPVTTTTTSSGTSVKPSTPTTTTSTTTAKPATSSSQNISPQVMADLEKLKGFMEKGIITEDEFQAKKKQLLGL